MTKYQVFKKVADEDLGTSWFVPLGVFESHDPQGAVAAAIVGSENPAELATSTFAATPAGSWKELTPAKVEVETKVRFA